VVARDVNQKTEELGDRNENGMMSLKEYAAGLTGWKWREIEEDGRLKGNEEEGQVKKRNTTSNSKPSKEDASARKLVE
jgi:hypothetical protein